MFFKQKYLDNNTSLTCLYVCTIDIMSIRDKWMILKPKLIVFHKTPPRRDQLGTRACHVSCCDIVPVSRSHDSARVSAQGCGPRHIILKSAQNWNVSSDTERSEDFEDPVNIFTQCIIDTVTHSWHHDSWLFIDVFILLFKIYCHLEFRIYCEAQARVRQG